MILKVNLPISNQSTFILSFLGNNSDLFFYFFYRVSVVDISGIDSNSFELLGTYPKTNRTEFTDEKNSL